MAVDIQELGKILEASLHPSQNKQAEIALFQEEKKPNFSLTLLQIVASASSSDTARLAGALYFKNFIRRRWADEDGKHQLPRDEVATIKRELIGLMISVPSNIQSQLGEAISVIADSDFWERWDTLVDDLVSRLTPDNTQINNGVLQVAHSIFKRWRPLYRSDPLYTEINHVLSKFGTPFLNLLDNTDRLIQQYQNDPNRLRDSFTSLNLIIKLFYDLSVHDLPPVFEDNLAAITTLLHKYLVYENPVLVTNDDTEAGLQEHVRAGIFELLQMWIQKYDDDFKPFVEQFIGSSWSLLTNIGLEVKYDILVSKALQFLTAVTANAQHAQAFNNEQTLGQIVERVILPNSTLRESDLELLEDEPIEFIRRDLEGSDSDTRRRASTDFLRALINKFEATVAGVVLRYIEHYLSEYRKNPADNWQSKDTAIYLYSAIAAKGAVTTSQGVTATNSFANVVEFFQLNIANDLVAEQGIPTILKVDAIKYLYVFRSQITPAQWQGVFPVLVRHLGSSEYVIYTYASIALERTMALSTVTKQPVIGRQEVEPLASELLRHQFGLIEQNPDPAKLQENEFLMRCIMRVLIVIKEGVLVLIDQVVPHFAKLISVACRNPSNPRFNYYLFEAVGALVRFGAPAQPDKLESELYEPFAQVLKEDVSEFAPYVFQLFAALLEANPSGTLPDYYKSLIPPILDAAPWSLKGNVPALARLLTAIIPRAASDLVQANQLETILLRFQRLTSTKANEIYGLELLECIFLSIPQPALQNYNKTILQVLFTRLDNSRTEPFALRFVRFYHFFSAMGDKGLGADLFISIADQIQDKIFVPIYLNIILPDTQKILRPLDRKTAVISLTKTLADSAAFADRYKKGWAYTCQALLKLLENPPEPAAPDDAIAEQDPDDMGFGVGFTQITTIKRQPKDHWPEIRDVKSWVGEYLRGANAQSGGKIASYAQERLDADLRALFSAYVSQ